MSRCHRCIVPVMSVVLSLGILVGVSSRGAAQIPYFNSTSIGAVKNGAEDFLIIFGSNWVDGREGSSPANTNIGFTTDFTGAQGTTTFSAYAAANYRGFWSTGTYAYGTVTNAYHSTTPPPGFDPPHGYVVLGGAGSWTQARFETPAALTAATATFRWNVTGQASADLGMANARLDFAVTQGAGSFFDLYNPTITPNLLTRFGPGNYSYNTGVALGVNLDFLFWSSAFWDVTPADIASLGSTPRNIAGSAMFNNTFTLDTIELLDSNGDPIQNWQLLDVTSGTTLFDQNGRVAAVPEPGVYALLLGALSAVSGLLHTRRRRSVRSL